MPQLIPSGANNPPAKRQKDQAEGKNQGGNKEMRKGKGPPDNSAGLDGDGVLVTPCLPIVKYSFEGYLRRVDPYFFTYRTNCKERWRGRPLMDIFEAEFRDRMPEYYRAAICSGSVSVNGRTVSPDYVVQNGDLIAHSTHRHEPPVTPDRIDVLHEDDGILVINKPSGIPVHPAGRYFYNSVIWILSAQRASEGHTATPPQLLMPCNRLDRLTSGIMFLAKNPRAAEDMRRQIVARSVRKEYLARVLGRFPDGDVMCDQPILQISPKVGLNRVRANGKAARTVFKRLAYYPPVPPCPSDPTSLTPITSNHDCSADLAQSTDLAQSADLASSPTNVGTAATEIRSSAAAVAAAEEEPVAAAEVETVQGFGASGDKVGYSIVRCMPVTGRTHQIRVHLQFLGHPVQNDPIYANRAVWGFDLGEADDDGSGVADEDVITRLDRVGKDQVADAVAYHDLMADHFHRRKAESLSGEICPVCQAPLYTDPGPGDLSLWLHSLRYEAMDGRWHYISPLPAWALPPDGASGPTEVGSMDDIVGVLDPFEEG